MNENMDIIMSRSFVCYFFYVGFHINLGINISPMQPNMEIHLPFSFIKIGRIKGVYVEEDKNIKFQFSKKCFGYRRRDFVQASIPGAKFRKITIDQRSIKN